MTIDFLCGHKGEPVICEDCRDDAAKWAYKQGMQDERERCAKLVELMKFDINTTTYNFLLDHIRKG